MAKVEHRKGRGKSVKDSPALPFTKDNYRLFGIGLLIIVLGYIALAQGPWDGFWSLTLAPILLVLGYCVIIPIAILYRKKSPKEAETN